MKFFPSIRFRILQPVCLFNPGKVNVFHIDTELKSCLFLIQQPVISAKNIISCSVPLSAEDSTATSIGMQGNLLDPRSKSQACFFQSISLTQFPAAFTLQLKDQPSDPCKKLEETLVRREMKIRQILIGLYVQRV